MTSRVIIACNTSHVVFAKACLASDICADSLYTVLLLANYSYSAEETYRQMEELANSSPEFDKVMWVNDFITPVKLQFDEETVKTNITCIQDALGKICNGEITQYWTWTIYNRFEQLLAEALPQADIVLYEDGVALVAPRPISEPCPDEGECSTWILNQPGISPHHIARIKTIPHLLTHDTFPSHIQKEKMKRIDKQAYVEALKKAIDCFGLTHTQNRFPQLGNVLVIGTPIYDILNHYSREQELSLYEQVIRKLIFQENCVVYWKDHPNISNPFADDLRKRINNDRFIVIETRQGTPIEYIAIQTHFKKSISIGSSAQKVLRDLFDIPYAVIQQPGLEVVDQAGESLATFRRAAPAFHLQPADNAAPAG